MVQTVIEPRKSKSVRPRSDEAEVDDGGNRCEQTSVDAVHENAGRPAVILAKGGLVRPERPNQ